MLAGFFVAGNADYSAAQTTPLVDYDVDDDGLIEVSNANQWRAIHYDLDGNGTPESRGAPLIATNTAWATAYPNAMTGAGCPARDHDGNALTPDQPSCIGYELVDDINLAGGRITLGSLGDEGFTRDAYTAKIVGNGFRIENNDRQDENSCCFGLVATLSYTGVIEGIGAINSRYSGTGGQSGGIVGRLEGTVIGSYVRGGYVEKGGKNGGIAGIVTTNAAQGRGLIAHSYVQGARIGLDGIRNGGLGGEFEHQRGTNPIHRSTCLNSYFSGDVDGRTDHQRRTGLVAGESQNNQGQFINCVGDSTTDASDGNNSTTGGGATGASTATYAAMTAATGYTGPFDGWDDYPIDGSITQLATTAPRTDVWDFGDETTLPVLKGWGHDRYMALDRGQTGTQTVNLCTRTLAVANEIIRLLKDDTFADGVSGPVPADITNLGSCTSATDTQNVSIDNLRDYAATTASNTLNLSPDRTSPASAKLTTIDWHDFAYLVNIAHIDLSGNALTSVPPRLFQGLPLRWLDLSYNELVSLPADLFAGLGRVPNTATTGNAVHLNGNALTDTGIPGRVFDTLTHINGLDLRDNALTRINTRWFEALRNLGDKPATATAPVNYLGLGLAGNAATEHYYANKLFAGVRYNIVAYTGATAADDLLTAIKAAITAAAGGTTPANLDLDSTDYYVNAGASAGYQPSGTSCPTGSTVGTLGDAYLNGDTPECYVLPHWSPPQTASPTVAAPTNGAIAPDTDGLEVSFDHAASATFLAYQIRYRVLPSDPDAVWTEHWIALAITRAAGTKSATISGTVAARSYQVQIRVVTTTGSSPPLTLLLPADLDPPPNFEIVEESGTLVLRWDGPAGFNVDSYQYRTRRSGATTWSDWMTVEHTGDRGSRQSHRLTELDSGITYEVELRSVVGSIPSDTTTVNAATRVSVPEVDSIVPDVRVIGIPAGQEIRLTVNIYNAQQALDNALATSADSLLVFRWSGDGPGGGTFADPANTRRVTYTAPSSPGTYRVTAEAQPDGICLSHHDGATEITAADRAPCIATFTINVSRAPSQPDARPDPINPAGVVPTSMTDDAGTGYTVFTPVDGGSFSSDDVTVSATAGAVPDRTLLGIMAAVSELPPPIPNPGASMSVAGNYYDINGIQQSGQAPLTAYTLNDPLTVCLPIPDQFRADLSNVVAVERKPDGGISILTTRVRAEAGDLTVCGAVSTLPATVAVAKLGTVPSIPATPAPEEDLPEAGATAPGIIALVMMLLAGLAILTGIGRIGRMRVLYYHALQRAWRHTLTERTLLTWPSSKSSSWAFPKTTRWTTSGLKWPTWMLSS